MSFIPGLSIEKWNERHCLWVDGFANCICCLVDITMPCGWMSQGLNTSEVMCHRINRQLVEILMYSSPPSTINDRIVSNSLFSSILLTKMQTSKSSTNAKKTHNINPNYFVFSKKMTQQLKIPTDVQHFAEKLALNQVHTSMIYMCAYPKHELKTFVVNRKGVFGPHCWLCSFRPPGTNAFCVHYHNGKQIPDHLKNTNCINARVQ